MELTMGTGQVFGPESLCSVRVQRQIDPLHGRLVPDTMQITLRTGQDLHTATDMQTKAVLTQGGERFVTHGVTGCSRLGQLHTLSCRSDTDFLRLQYMGGLFENETIGGILDEMLLDRDAFCLDAQAGLISGHIPICTRGEALQMIAFSQAAYLRMDREGLLDMQQLTREDPLHIPPERIITQPELEILPGYSRVELVSHRYTVANNWVTVFSGREFPPEEQTVKFSEPVKRIDLSQSQVLHSGANYVTFLPAAVDDLRTLPYLHSKTWHSYQRPQDTGNTRILTVRDNTLITNQRATALMAHLQEMALLRQTLKLQILVDGEDVGRYVTVDTPWGTTYGGYITKMDSTLTPQRHTAWVTVLASQQES